LSGSEASAYTYVVFDTLAVVRGVGGVPWELEGLDSASPVFWGPGKTREG
jgi:hypothetical protein